MKALACALLLAVAAGASAAGPAGPDIAKIFATWKAGYESRDVAKILSIYTKDLKFSFQGQPDLDLNGLRDSYITDFESRHPKWTWASVTEAVHADSRLAIAISTWTCYEETLLGAPKMTMRIRSIDMLKPTPDGWKIFHTINYPEPPTTP